MKTLIVLTLVLVFGQLSFAGMTSAQKAAAKRPLGDAIPDQMITLEGSWTPQQIAILRDGVAAASTQRTKQIIYGEDAVKPVLEFTLGAGFNLKQSFERASLGPKGQSSVAGYKILSFTIPAGASGPEIAAYLADKLPPLLINKARGDGDQTLAALQGPTYCPNLLSVAR